MNFSYNICLFEVLLPFAHNNVMINTEMYCSSQLPFRERVVAGAFNR